jgi:hypothetical protein
MSEDTVPRRTLPPMGEEVIERCEKLNNEEFYNLCSLAYIICAIKSQIMRSVK